MVLVSGALGKAAEAVMMSMRRTAEKGLVDNLNSACRGVYGKDGHGNETKTEKRQGLTCMEHRGACSADRDTGDDSLLAGFLHYPVAFVVFGAPWILDSGAQQSGRQLLVNARRKEPQRCGKTERRHLGVCAALFLSIGHL
eukprot:Plantae.Rhodophyta-Palmaria_palmata.ctg2894.p2 GENE.Plantae.Rhodophyta-Palmaria_palmata.ctg2894~~Plantae.Rhodophyta-Palmaria_palmata.ctg2894.p2  ORF type:complete len:141 (+),score=11.10 Plantae.Rhodophyta-Palmaria_palmata.ctg2894:313-735(+)